MEGQAATVRDKANELIEAVNNAIAGQRALEAENTTLKADLAEANQKLENLRNRVRAMLDDE